MRKYINKKVLLGLSALLLAFIVITVSSFVPFIIDPTRWQTQKFLTDELITCAIVIFSMLCMFIVGQASNGQDERSNLSKSRVKFMESIKKIDNFNSFTQWVLLVMQKHDIEEIKERELRKVGIEDLSVLDLELNEIKALLDTPQKYNGRFYKGLNKEQIKKILDIRKGKYNVDFVSPTYYLTMKNIGSAKTISEKAGSENKRKGLFLTWSIVSKLIITIVVAMIFASLVRDLSSELDKGEAWLNFASRVFSMVSSSFMGYYVGCQMNDIDAEYIENRVIAHTKYLQDKDFQPLTEQEFIKKMYVERCKKEERLLIEKKD